MSRFWRVAARRTRPGAPINIRATEQAEQSIGDRFDAARTQDIQFLRRRGNGGQSQSRGGRGCGTERVVADQAGDQRLLRPRAPAKTNEAPAASRTMKGRAGTGTGPPRRDCAIPRGELWNITSLRCEIGRRIHRQLTSHIALQNGASLPKELARWEHCPVRGRSTCRRPSRPRGAGARGAEVATGARRGGAGARRGPRTRYGAEALEVRTRQDLSPPDQIIRTLHAY
jgi:hypothetical protein